MSKGDRYVVSHPDGWAVRREGTKMASSVHNTQSQAIVAGISAIMNSGGGELRILNHNGEVQESRTIGPTNDPFHPRDQRPSMADGAPAGESAAPAGSGQTESRRTAETLSAICGLILKAVPWLGDQDRSKSDSAPYGSDREIETPDNHRHVMRHPNGWAVKAGSSQRASSVHVTQDDAIVAARSILRNNGGGELVVHNRAGEIRHKFTIPPRNGPFPPRG